jgi:hypothetical protein
MKNLFLACLCIFTFEEAFSQTRYIDINKEQEGREKELRKQSGDEVVTGQSATERKTQPPGSLKEVQKSDSIQGVNCVDTRGQAYAPNSKGYKKCVDNANRVQ